MVALVSYSLNHRSLTLNHSAVEEPQSRLWGRIGDCRSWSSVPNSGPLQVCPDGTRTLLWTIWVWHSLGWGDGLICPHQRLGRKAPARPRKGFHNLKDLRGRSSQRGVQDLRGLVLRGHLVTNSHLSVEPGLVGIRPKWTDSRWFSGEQWMVSCFLFAYLIRAMESWLALILASTARCWEQRQAAWIQQRRTSCQGHGLDSPKKAGEMTDPCGLPASTIGKAMGVFCKNKSPSCLRGMPRAI